MGPMIVPGLLVLAVLSNGGASETSAPPHPADAQAESQAEFRRAWHVANSYFSDETLTVSKAYVERQMTAINALTHRVLLRYGKPISNADSEIVLKVSQEGRVEKVLVDQNSHLRILFAEECKSLQLERPPKVPFYLGVAIGAPAVE